MSVAIEDIYPLSPLQQGLLFHALGQPGQGIYVEQASYLIHGDVDVETFRRAWQDLIQRHSVLRTGFVWEDLADPLQVVSANVELPFEVHDLRGLDPLSQQEQVLTLERSDRRDFDLSRAPLLRVGLYLLSETSTRFSFSHHHLLLDGWSTQTLLNDMFDLYDAHAMGVDPQLPPAVPYRDYIAWLQGQDLKAAEQLWREELKGLRCPTSLPWQGAMAGQSGPPLDGLSRVHELSRETSEALEAMAKLHRLTLNTLVQGAWALILSVHSAQDDVLFGGVISGRPPELAGVMAMVGLFINTLPVRVRVHPDRALLPWLHDLLWRQTELQQYSYTPLLQLRGWSELGSDQPLFDSVIAFENFPSHSSARRGREASIQGQWRVSHTASHSRTSYPLSLMVLPGERLTMRLMADPSRYETAMLDRLLSQLATILEAFTVHPDASLGDLLGPSREDLHLQWGDWNATSNPYPRDKSLWELFKQQQLLRPAATALIEGDTRLTYEQLAQRAEQLAAHLRSNGAGPGCLVGLALPRSSALVVSCLAIINVGAAYVPLDPEAPAAHQGQILSDAAIALVIADQHFQASALPPEATLLRWDVISQVPPLSSGHGSGTNGGPATQAQASPGESLAYVMYTSGSTGRPKGVKIPHRAVARLVLNTNYIQIQADDRLAFISSPAFDAATFEIWGALLNGAALVVVAKPVSLDPAALARFIAHQRLTVMFLTTALFNLMASEQPAAFGMLRYLLFGGSASNPSCVSKVLSSAAPKQLLHCYGPTETTTFATVQVISRVAPDQRLPIGRPIANSTAYVLNTDLQPLPIGAPGEIVLGGDGVSLGYLNRSDLDSRHFIDQVSTPTGLHTGRVYRSGDRGRFLADGSIDFLGRLDQQVKLRGFRIEPSEVEQALTRQAGVAQAVVLVDIDSVGDERLVAYLVGDGDNADDARLMRHLQTQLPSYMVPSQLVWLERLPLTANGKVELGALPKPQTNKASSALSDQPQTPLEQRLATIWGELLGVSQVGRRDNFFELGGQSLKVAQLVSRIRDAFQVSLPIQATFEAPTIAALAPIVEDLVLSQVESLEDGPVEGAS